VTIAILVAVALGCLVVAPLVLRSTTIFDSVPRVGVALWTALGLLGWLAVIATSLRVALGDRHLALVVALAHFVGHLRDGHPLRGLGFGEVVGLSVAFDLVVVFVGALGVTSWRVGQTRRAQRTVLDLVARRSPHDKVRVLDHPQPTAYYLPGKGGRVVLSTGALAVLDDDELAAIVTHELGHRHGRHGAMLAPLEALSSFVAFLPLARYGPVAVRSYLEMTADDRCRRRGSAPALRRALSKSSIFRPAPAGTFSAVGDVIERRIERLDTNASGLGDYALVVTLAAWAGFAAWFMLAGH